MQSGSPLWGGLEHIKALSSGHKWCLDTHRSTMKMVADKVLRVVGVCDGLHLGIACS
jgi:hypothetical protein